MENINAGNIGNKDNKKAIQKRIEELEKIEKIPGDSEATLSDVANEEKFNILKIGIENEQKQAAEINPEEKKVIELAEKEIKDYQKKIKDFCYYFISLNVAIEESKDIPLVKKELRAKGIKVTNQNLEDISNLFLKTVTLSKEQIDNIKEKFLNNKEKNEESFEDFLKKNDSLDTVMLYEICNRKIKKGATENDETYIKNEILKVLEDVDDFNDKKNVWTVLKKETEKGKYKNQVRLIELENLMEEVFEKKLEKFRSDEYREIFKKINNIMN